jgi:serine/threonine-protein kinase
VPRTAHATTPTDTTPDLVGATVAGRYRVTGFLGRGGFGSVYQGVDVDSGTAVALKAFSRRDGLAPRAGREARAARKLSHPNVHHVLGVEQDETHAYLVSELVVGERFDRSGLGDEEAVRAIAAVCDALAHAHAHGIVHRDVKPSNILISTAGEVTLTDFGIARDEDAADQTVDERLLGTLSYMAPEQAAGEQATGASDVWAAAVTLYEALTGGNPFRARKLADLLQRFEAGAPSLAALRPDLPPALSRTIAEGLRRDPRKRPEAAAFRDALLAAIAPEPGPAAPVELGPAVADDPLAEEPLADERSAARAPRERRLPRPSADAPGVRLATRAARAALVGGALAWTLSAFPVYPPSWTPVLAALCALVAFRLGLAGLALAGAVVVPAFWNGSQAAGLTALVLAGAWLVHARRDRVRAPLPLLAGGLTLAGVGPAYVLVAATARTPARRAVEGAAGAVVAIVAAGPLTGAESRELAGASSPLALLSALAAHPALLAVLAAAAGFSVLLPAAWRVAEHRRRRALLAWGLAFALAALALAQLPGVVPGDGMRQAVIGSLAAILPAACALAAPRLGFGR